MRNTTLCYLKKDGCYLMLHRIKKENDLNHDKYIGVGGKFLEDESPDECLLREVKEETGLTLTDYRCCGIVTFVSDIYETEQMYLYFSDKFTGVLTECDEGVPEWISMERFRQLPKWEGDMIFLELMERNVPFFTLKLRYEADSLVYAALNGKELEDLGRSIWKKD
ncbi:MAG: 8-oxo-dGTP diphosphatase [Eubacteriaceae bacterium]|nr:8-oxo-dGTP diphosphatase [Eubacteriaceae bacterium]